MAWTSDAEAPVSAAASAAWRAAAAAGG